MTDAIVVLVTAPSADKAAELARALVEEQLAACGNVLPGLRSIYRWEGKVHDEPEALLILKTRASLFEALRAGGGAPPIPGPRGAATRRGRRAPALPRVDRGQRPVLALIRPWFHGSHLTPGVSLEPASVRCKPLWLGVDSLPPCARDTLTRPPFVSFLMTPIRILVADGSAVARRGSPGC